MWRVLCLLLMLASAGWRDAVAATPRAGIESALALPEALRLGLPAEVQDRGIDHAVRVQRLQEISREDAIAEGCESPLIGSEAPRPGPGVYLADERTSFAQLWNRLKGPGSWDANPWVVAITFTAHRCNIDARERSA